MKKLAIWILKQQIKSTIKRQEQLKCSGGYLIAQQYNQRIASYKETIIHLKS